MYQIQRTISAAAPRNLLGPITVQVNIFTNYGRPDQQHKSLTVRLAEQSSNVTAVGEMRSF